MTLKRWKEMTHEEKTAVVASRPSGAPLKELAALYGCAPGTMAAFTRAIGRTYAGKAVRLRKISQVMVAIEPEPTGPGVPLLKLTSCSCRWPLWPNSGKPSYEAMLFCGEPTAGENPYCVEHKPYSIAAPDKMPDSLKKQHHYPKGLAA